MKKILLSLISFLLFSSHLLAEPQLPKGVDKDQEIIYYENKSRGHGETGVTEGVSGFRKFLNRTKITGYFDVEFDSKGGSNGNSSFRAHRFILGVSSQLTPWLSMNTEIEIENGGTSDIPNGEYVRIEQGYLDASVHDLLTFRAGIILVPMGRLNILHDSNLLDFTSRPLVNRVIVPTTWSEVGIGIHGFHNFENNMAINYELYVVNGLASPNADGNTLANSGNRNIRNGVSSDNNSDKGITGRLGFSPFIGFELGASFYTGNLADKGSPSNRITFLGADLRYQSKSWELGNNTLIGPIEFEGEIYKTFLDADKNSGLGGQLGAYAQVNFHWFPGAFRNALPGGTFTNSFRYNYVDTNTSNDLLGKIQRFDIGFNFRPIEPFVIKAEYQLHFDSDSETDNRFLASMALAF